jgi:hypothetical protein
VHVVHIHRIATRRELYPSSAAQHEL